jgi:short-subunit dehydrogenase
MRFALITGASSGIGLAFSRELASRGFNILLISNQAIELNNAGKELREKYKICIETLVVDLAHAEAAQEVFEHCKKNYFEIEILINNAGIFFYKDISKTDKSLINKILYLHIFTPTLLSKLFATDWKNAQKSGFILNMVSIAAYMKFPGITLYEATKAYLRTFSHSICEEFDRKQISVTTICPGAVATDLYNLSSKYQKLGVRIGIIITPEKLAKNAVNQMFKRKKQYIPAGFINRITIGFTAKMPHFFIQKIKKFVDKIYFKHTNSTNILNF